MSAGIEVKEFKYIPGQNDAEYIKLLEENSERWKQIANSTISKLKRMSAERTEIVHCKDCLGKGMCSWERIGAEFCSLGERGEEDDQ